MWNQASRRHNRGRYQQSINRKLLSDTIPAVSPSLIPFACFCRFPFFLCLPKQQRFLQAFLISQLQGWMQQKQAKGMIQGEAQNRNKKQLPVDALTVLSFILPSACLILHFCRCECKKILRTRTKARSWTGRGDSRVTIGFLLSAISRVGRNPYPLSPADTRAHLYCLHNVVDML